MPESADKLDHIGWDLWRATQAWKARFVAGMVKSGHPWFAEARGNLIHLIGPSGIKQGLLPVKSHMTKQAVQQFLDELEKDGVVKRSVDPDDARGRIVQFTEKGRRVFKDAEKIKQQIEADYEALIGRSALKQLKSSLDKIAGSGK